MKNAIRSSSTKGFTLVEIMIVVVIIGLLAAMAIPAFQKVRDNSRRKSIENNIRQLAAGADQYFLENGVTQVNITALVGTDSYVKELKTVANESYGNSITQGTTYSITYAGGASAITGNW